MRLALLQRSDIKMSIEVDDTYFTVRVGLQQSPGIGVALVIGAPDAKQNAIGVGLQNLPVLLVQQLVGSLQLQLRCNIPRVKHRNIGVIIKLSLLQNLSEYGRGHRPADSASVTLGAFIVGEPADDDRVVMGALGWLVVPDCIAEVALRRHVEVKVTIHSNLVYYQLYMNQQAKQVIKDLPPCHLYFNKGITINKPEILMKMETSHIMILFFYIGGLHILDKEQALDENQLREKLVEYIMSLKQSKGGFGSCPLYASFPKASKYEQSHIVFIFSAVNSLFILKAGDRLDKAQILSNLARYQKQDGSFSSFPSSTECDLRFVYSALSVCKLFGDFSQIDTAKAQKYIESCFNFDGGFGLRPRNQSHCGAVFCAVASYSCLGLCLPPRQKQKIVHFLVNRQVPHTVEKLVGIQGRVGKHPDSCYSFWAGASLQLLVGRNLLNPEIEQFLMACFKKEQCSFAKFMQNTSGDPVHTFHSIIGLKILGEQADDIELRHLLKKKLIG